MTINDCRIIELPKFLDAGIGVIACAPLASAHTDDSLAYAVVEQGDIHL